MLFIHLVGTAILHSARHKVLEISSHLRFFMRRHKFLDFPKQFLGETIHSLEGCSTRAIPFQQCFYYIIRFVRIVDAMTVEL